MLRYCSLFSGSSGNCIYAGTADGGILLDVGVSAKRIETALRERDIDPTTIRAVFLTHEHSDHVAGLQVLCKRYGWAVLASEGTLDALCESGKLDACRRVYMMEPGQSVTVSGLQVSSYATPHDSRQCFGYRIDGEGRSLAVATDLGYMPDEVLDVIRGCDLIHIESNHDPDLLRNGPYPYYLQQRILGQGGHLSNGACAAVLPSLVEAGTTRIVLAHLSEQNNTPVLAQRCAAEGLAACGIAVGRDCLLTVAEPTGTQAVTYF